VLYSLGKCFWGVSLAVGRRANNRLGPRIRERIKSADGAGVAGGAEVDRRRRALGSGKARNAGQVKIYRRAACACGPGLTRVNKLVGPS
jgi:hypothetical protein